MQDTRLNSLINRSSQQLALWLDNPWRRFSLIIIGLLFGFFLANAIATVTGQTADFDVLAAFVMLIFVELVSWYVYSTKPLNREKKPVLRRRSLGVEVLNATKIGVIYGLFLEAFKLGS